MSFLRFSLFSSLILWAAVAFSDSNHKITVYGADDCSRTSKTREILKENQIPFVYKKVRGAGTESAHQEMWSKVRIGQPSATEVDFPVVEVDGKIFINPSPQQIMALYRGPASPTQQNSSGQGNIESGNTPKGSGKHQINVFGTTECPATSSMRQTLQQNHIPFVFKNIDHDAENQELSRKDPGAAYIPVVEFDGRIIGNVGADEVISLYKGQTNIGQLPAQPSQSTQSCGAGQSSAGVEEDGSVALTPVAPKKLAPVVPAKEIAELSFDQIKSKLSGSAPILVDVFADNCPLCVSMDSSLSVFMAKHPEVQVYKTNGNKSDEIRTTYRVTKVPTFVLFNGPRAATLLSFDGGGRFDGVQLASFIEQGMAHVGVTLGAGQPVPDQEAALQEQPQDDYAAPAANQSTAPEMTIDKSIPYQIVYYTSFQCGYCQALTKALNATTGTKFYPIDVNGKTYQVPLKIVDLGTLDEAGAKLGTGVPNVQLILGGKIVKVSEGYSGDPKEYRDDFRPYLANYLKQNHLEK